MIVTTKDPQVRMTKEKKLQREVKTRKHRLNVRIEVDKTLEIIKIKISLSIQSTKINVTIKRRKNMKATGEKGMKEIERKTIRILEKLAKPRKIGIIAVKRIM